MLTRATSTRWVLLLLFLLCVSPASSSIGVPFTTAAFAQSKTKDKKETKVPKKGKAAPVGGPVADYSSKNFLIHTDLAPDQAEGLLKRMETMLTLISKYWGRPAVGVIECYVVEDLQKWPAGSIDERGLPAIEGNAGVTVSLTVTDGDNFVSKAVVFAVADRGTPLHESVHAYCTHAFGRTGPVWYSEGMAEMGQYWKEGDLGVNAHDIVIEYLKENEPKPLLEIVNRNERSGDSWQNYAWRWALCHLLCNNPNYAARFRPLGIGLLTKQNVSFESVYGDMSDEIQFEYKFFLKHLEKGYRVDLTRWDWKAKFKPNKTSAPTGATIEAGLGWQPSKLKVVKDDVYEYSAAGTWTVEKDKPQVTADGDSNGRGKLLGIVMTDYELGEPFELGAFGTFTAPAEGNLYLRCNDAWVELSDNKGKISVKLKTQGKGAPLVAPASDDKPKTAKPLKSLSKPDKTEPQKTKSAADAPPPKS